MPASRISEVVERLRETELLQEAVTDGQLLERFVANRDEGSLATLVRRHAPMVWGVCRRMLLRHHDAEDAFQATFLVLVRKASSVWPRELVANWLHGVACQTALKARATAAKQRARERQVTVMPERGTVDRDPWQDIQPLFDQALGRLPEKYRAPIVLCDLQGKSRKQAAQQLGLPEGTVASRLARGRAMLAKRLARLGVVLSGAVLTVAVAQHATSAAPALLLASTIHAARLWATGRAAAVISARVVSLTEGVLKAMLLTKLKTVVGVLLAAALGVGVAGFAYFAQAGEPAARSQAVGAKPQLPPLSDQEQLAKELRQMRVEIERLRAEVERLRGQKVAPTPQGAQPDQAQAAKVREEKQVIKVYAVGDLISPDPDNEGRSLISLVTNIVEPRAWSTAGGDGGIEYFPEAKSLVISHTPDIHERVQGLLKSLREAKKEQEKIVQPLAG